MSQTNGEIPYATGFGYGHCTRHISHVPGCSCIQQYLQEREYDEYATTEGNEFKLGFQRQALKVQRSNGKCIPTGNHVRLMEDPVREARNLLRGSAIR